MGFRAPQIWCLRSGSQVAAGAAGLAATVVVDERPDVGDVEAGYRLGRPQSPLSQISGERKAYSPKAASAGNARSTPAMPRSVT